MPRVLVTGATGFVGGHLVDHYCAEGWEVHGICRGCTCNEAAVRPGAILHPVDLLDGEAVAAVIAEVQPDVVHHLAAQSSVAVSWQDPIGTLTANATMQYHVLDAIRALPGAIRVIVAGSSDEYGQVPPEENPIGEHAVLLPVNPYAVSKVAQEMMAYQYFAHDGMNVIRTRSFLQLGPRRDDRFVAGSFARQVAEIVLGRRDPAVRVGNIDLRRDFTDVRDVVAALRLLADRGAPGEAYNIASGQPHTLREILELMLRECGVDVEIQVDPALQRANEAPLLIGDATKLRAATGWTPTISLAQSVKDTLAYWITRLRSSEMELGGTR